jgi:hypothetical protein
MLSKYTFSNDPAAATTGSAAQTDLQSNKEALQNPHFSFLRDVKLAQDNSQDALEDDFHNSTIERYVVGFHGLTELQGLVKNCP